MHNTVFVIAQCHSAGLSTIDNTATTIHTQRAWNDLATKLTQLRESVEGPLLQDLIRRQKYPPMATPDCGACPDCALIKHRDSSERLTPDRLQDSCCTSTRRRNALLARVYRLTYLVARPKISAKRDRPRCMATEEGLQEWTQSAVVLHGTHSSQRPK